jgi:hypothetical protein
MIPFSPNSHQSAAFSYIGGIMAVFGSQVMSFMAKVCMVTIKTFKSLSVRLSIHETSDA